MGETVDEPVLIPRDAQEKLDRFFLTPRRFYFEREFSSLAATLGQNGMYEWAQVPKLYFVLRSLGRQHLISTFVSRGLTDASIPIEDDVLSSVAGCPSSEFHARFQKYQKRAQKHDTAVYEESLATFFASSIDASKKSIGDAEFGEVARLLEFCGKSDAAKTPKLYYLLRSINELESLPTFHAKGYSDLWLPFPKSSLNSGLFQSKASQQLFLNSQSLVCSTRWSEHVHMNFDEDEIEFIDHRRELGEGGTGEVDLVYCASTGKEYARKRVLRTSQGLRYFSNEIAMLKSVCHQHCVSLVGSYTDPYNLAILCLPVADMNLATLLDAGMIPNDRKDLLQSSFCCLSVAVRYLHGKDIRHKDIKPQNILIHGNNLLFTDFGLSSDEIQNFATTASKTARYSAPEVEDGARRDFASDVWALGCVFLEIVAALCGFKIDDVKEYFRNHGEKRLNFAANASAIQSFLTETWVSEKLQHYKHIPNAVTDLTLDMLKFIPGDRPATDSLVSRLSEGLQESQNPYGRCCRYEIMKAQQPTGTGSNSVRQRADWDGTGTSLVANKPDTELTGEKAPVNTSTESQQDVPHAQSTYSKDGRKPYAAYYSSCSGDSSEEEGKEIENNLPRALAPRRTLSPKSPRNRSNEQQIDKLIKEGDKLNAPNPNLLIAQAKLYFLHQKAIKAEHDRDFALLADLRLYAIPALEQEIELLTKDRDDWTTAPNLQLSDESSQATSSVQNISSLRNNELSQEDAHNPKSATAHLATSKSTEQTEIASIPLRSRRYDTKSTGPIFKSQKPPVEPPHSEDKNPTRANEEPFQPFKRFDHEIRDDDKRKTSGDPPPFDFKTKKKPDKKGPSNAEDIFSQFFRNPNSNPHDKLPENKSVDYSKAEDIFRQFFRETVGDETIEEDYSRPFNRNTSKELSDNKPPTAARSNRPPPPSRSKERLGNFPPPPRRSGRGKDVKLERTASTLQSKENVLEEDNGNDKYPLQDPNPLKWTRIPRDLVSPQVLREAGELFEIQDNHIKIFRTVPRDEIQALAERTKDIERLRMTNAFKAWTAMNEQSR